MFIKTKMKLKRSLFEFLKKYCTKVGDTTNSNVSSNSETTYIQKVSVFRTITNSDIQNFAKLTNDFNPIHINMPNNIVHGALLNGFVSGVIGTKLPGPGTIVVEQNLSFPKPCYVGETIEIKVHIVSARKIMNCEYICIANGNKIVLKGDAKLIKKNS